jgi:cytochrome d ubiquinol oxidase subunit II
VDLQTIWFVLVAVLFTGYFFLEGFDFGVGILMPFLGKNDTDRRVIINTIGPFWDGNEVWLLTAGGAMFAAFPHWYATLFSGFYLALFLILVALILRVAGLEFRSKVEDPRWRRTADAFIFIGSAVPALLWGVALTNIVRGVPIDASMNFTGTLLTLLNPYALVGGLVSLLVFTLHGALFLSLRTTDDIRDKALAVAKTIWWPAGGILLGFYFWGQYQTDLFDTGIVPNTFQMTAILSYLASYAFMRLRMDGWAFATTGLTIIIGTVVAFQGLFPRVMLFVALFFVPIVLLYQGYTYWVFRKRVTREMIAEAH